MAGSDGAASSSFDDYPHDRRVIIYPVRRLPAEQPAHAAGHLCDRRTSPARELSSRLPQIYFNSKMSIPEGRRVALKHCVEHPSLNEMRDVCQHLGLECAVEVRAGPVRTALPPLA